MIASSIGGWLSFEIAQGARQRVAEVAVAKRKAAVAQAVADARDAKDKLDSIIKQLDELDTKIERAVDLVVGADNDRDRAAAKVRLVALQQEQYEIKVRYTAARARAPREHVHISKTCLQNPLAAGCI